MRLIVETMECKRRNQLLKQKRTWSTEELHSLQAESNGGHLFLNKLDEGVLATGLDGTALHVRAGNVWKEGGDSFREHVGEHLFGDLAGGEIANVHLAGLFLGLLGGSSARHLLLEDPLGCLALRLLGIRRQV
jgi:hypothetical protein